MDLSGPKVFMMSDQTSDCQIDQQRLLLNTRGLWTPPSESKSETYSLTSHGILIRLEHHDLDSISVPTGLSWIAVTLLSTIATRSLGEVSRLIIAPALVAEFRARVYIAPVVVTVISASGGCVGATKVVAVCEYS